MPGDESKEERLDRELIELLNELRVALPGVQVLFAFLLGVPFTQRFGQVSDLQKDVYFLTFLFAAISTALLIAPSAYHRLEWRRGDKEHLLVVSNRLAIGGTVFLALAISGAVFVVTDMLFDARSAAIVAALTAAFFGWFWYGLPLLRMSRSRG
jgi:SNF family Na+-dependent transporter